ncbi:hypothetical protein AB0C29_02470 [Actinoplanes sp. NPDC048791]|uniref:hypothetical protein n=1 Tax=Actinoplanes sp. NPDC048791 TaxID=3154623 RepID=UPI0033DA49BA
MTDAIFLALLGIAGDVLQRIAGDVLTEFAQRHRAGGRTEVTAGQLRRAVDRMRSGLTELRQSDLRGVAPHEWEAAVSVARTSLTGAGIDLALVFDASSTRRVWPGSSRPAVRRTWIAWASTPAARPFITGWSA